MTKEEQRDVLVKQMIRTISQHVELYESQLNEARKEREDLLLEAHEDLGVSISELGRLANIRRESAHYAIARARTRRDFDAIVPA